jgi:hypothetical protein
VNTRRFHPHRFSFCGPISEQHDFAGALRKSEALRQSILKKAFTGRLVPQDPADEPASDLLTRVKASRGLTQATPPRRRGKVPSVSPP